MYLCGEFRNNGDWIASRVLIQHNIRYTEFIVNLGNSYRVEQSDAYAMRLHSVHPKISTHGSPEPTMRLKGVRFFCLYQIESHTRNCVFKPFLIHFIGKFDNLTVQFHKLDGNLLQFVESCHRFLFSEILT